MHATTYTNIHTYVRASNNTYTNIKIFNNTQTQAHTQITPTFRTKINHINRGFLRSSLCPTIADCMKPRVTDSNIYIYIYICVCVCVCVCVCSIIDNEHYLTILQHLVLH